jgi:thioredoxin 1
MAFRGGYLVYREAGAMSGPQFEELVKAVKALDIEKLKEQANAQQEGAEA